MRPIPCKPDRMTPDDRLAEVAALLAQGYLRLVQSREKESRKDLDARGPNEAPCDPLNARRRRHTQASSTLKDEEVA